MIRNLQYTLSKVLIISHMSECWSELTRNIYDFILEFDFTPCVEMQRLDSHIIFY